MNTPDADKDRLIVSFGAATALHQSGQSPGAAIPLHKPMEVPMSTTNSSRSAPVSARKTAKNKAREGEAQLREEAKLHLREIDAVRKRIIHAADTAALKISSKRWGGPTSKVQISYWATLNLLAVAMEAEAARIAGFESWAGLEKAEYSRMR